MTSKKKEIEKELIVTNVRSKDDSVILGLRFIQFKGPTKHQLQNIIDPMPKSEMEKMGKDIAKGYMEIMQKQMQPISQLLPHAPPPDTIQITLSEKEYIEIGRPTVLDKLTLKLRIKTVQNSLKL